MNYFIATPIYHLIASSLCTVQCTLVISWQHGRTRSFHFLFTLLYCNSHLCIWLHHPCVLYSECTLVQWSANNNMAELDHSVSCLCQACKCELWFVRTVNFRICDYFRYFIQNNFENGLWFNIDFLKPRGRKMNWLFQNL